MERCKTCRHWREMPSEPMGECLAAELLYQRGRVAKMPAAHLDYPACSLMTQPEFGCTLWSAKDGAAAEAN